MRASSPFLLGGQLQYRWIEREEDGIAAESVSIKEIKAGRQAANWPSSACISSLTRCVTPERLHRGIPHYLLNACLIHRELRQVLFGGLVRHRYSGKVVLHVPKDTARFCQSREVIVALILGDEFALPTDARMLVLNMLLG
jgi:hypothetical protein